MTECGRDVDVESSLDSRVRLFEEKHISPVNARSRFRFRPDSHSTGVAAELNRAELAKQLSNPIAALISVPLQLNCDRDIGAENQGDDRLLNIQPESSFSIGEEWNLISRTILPVMWQDDKWPHRGRSKSKRPTAGGPFLR